MIACEAMSRTPVLTAMLWTSVGTAALGCGEVSAPIVDAAALDARPIDAEATVDGPPPALSFAAGLQMRAECGGLTEAATLTIDNVAGQAVTITNIATTGGFFVKTATPIAIAVGQQLQLVVTPPAAVVGTDRGGAEIIGTLTITADVGGELPPVELKSTIVGANLDLVDAASQPIAAIALDSPDATCPAPQTVFVRNQGNADANLFVSGASSFGFGGFSPSSTVPAGGMVSQDVTVLSFNGGCTGSETITYQATGLVCTDPPALQASFNIAGSSFCFCS